MPFGSRKAALKNARHRGYFNSAQALADYASILLHIKDKYNATHAPVIAIGASYGGGKWLYAIMDVAFNFLIYFYF